MPMLRITSILLSLVPSVAMTQAATRPVTTKAQCTAYAMAHQGDAERGKQLFSDRDRLACTLCHSTDGKGGKPGPDLATIGDKFGRRDLIDSILFPSATIAVGYSTAVVRTNDGDVHVGVLKDGSAKGVTLVGIDGALVQIPAADIRRQRTSDISLMPEGLEEGLTGQEFADLVEYLASLKLPESAAAVHHGMPATITELEHPIALVPFFKPEVKFAHPVWFGPVPGVDAAFAVVEHETGRIVLLDRATGDTTSTFLETGKFQTGTRGLLGLAFHPKYAQNRRYFFPKHTVRDGRYSTVIFEGQAAPDLRKDSGQPPRAVLKIDETSNVHYGGGLQFGPDSSLYIGMGDSGPQQDPQGHGQDLSLLLGKMLRIDVDHAGGELAYSIPPDNPLIGRAGARPEIWAYGFREPWRFSFDPLTGDLWVGDVGQDLYEEVDLVRRGENHGWNVFEGFEPFSNKYRREGESFTAPVFAYSRKYGVSVTGGFVYRADPKSSFYGAYIFADYESRRIFALTHDGRTVAKVRQIGRGPERIVSFGRDARGQLYVVGYEGTIFRMDFSAAKFE
jgi:putative heme-binding domain-containing protein